VSDAIALKVDGGCERFKNQKRTYGCLKEWPQEGKVTGSLEVLVAGCATTVSQCVPLKKNCPAKRLATPKIKRQYLLTHRVTGCSLVPDNVILYMGKG
jgi:hypothetical protein